MDINAPMLVQMLQILGNREVTYGDDSMLSIVRLDIFCVFNLLYI